jgi:hypothetical protein
MRLGWGLPRSGWLSSSMAPRAHGRTPGGQGPVTLTGSLSNLQSLLSPVTRDGREKSILKLISPVCASGRQLTSCHCRGHSGSVGDQFADKGAGTMGWFPCPGAESLPPHMACNLACLESRRANARNIARLANGRSKTCAHHVQAQSWVGYPGPGLHQGAPIRTRSPAREVRLAISARGSHLRAWFPTVAQGVQQREDLRLLRGPHSCAFPVPLACPLLRPQQEQFRLAVECEQAFQTAQMVAEGHKFGNIYPPGWGDLRIIQQYPLLLADYPRSCPLWMWTISYDSPLPAFRFFPLAVTVSRAFRCHPPLATGVRRIRVLRILRSCVRVTSGWLLSPVSLYLLRIRGIRSSPAIISGGVRQYRGVCWSPRPWCGVNS